ncbi:MAG: tetratricopeptide repeat protein [Steroidobacter sp.]
MFDLSPDLVFALLLAAIAGWFAGRLRRQSPAPRTPLNISNSYFAGLNHLLNEQQDKALDVLHSMAEQDADAVEIQLALGHLYRRRGEVDRAIRIHEDVVNRSDVTQEWRNQARVALGDDYLRAGLLDRAEDCFQQLINSAAHRNLALRNLLNIYEQQGDWQQAIGIYQQLAANTSPENPTALAHYYCELADDARADGDLNQAREWLHEAREVQRNFPRSALLRADIALAEKDARLAGCLSRRVLELHPHLLHMALPRYVQALRMAGKTFETADADLQLHVADAAQRAQLAYAAIIMGVLDDPFLIACVPDFLARDANLGELVTALAGDVRQATSSQMQAIATALSRIFRRTQKFRCVDCGVTTGTHFWQCPGCRSWDTLVTVARLELSPSNKQ